MENFENWGNEIDKDQATVRMTPEEVAERRCKLDEDEERQPAYHPNAGVGPRDDVVMSEEAFRIGDERKANDKEGNANEQQVEEAGDPEDMNDLLVTDDEDNEDGEGLGKAT